MRRIRPAGERGVAGHAGGERRCAFSSGDFHDPGWTGFGALRVLNELRLVRGAGPGHPRANMEELGYVVAGSLEGGDAPDGGTVSLDPGALFWTGAGHGSEAAATGWVAGPQGATVLQAWLQPDRVNAAPAHAWRPAAESTPPGWRCLASPDGAAGAVAIRQQAWLRLGTLTDAAGDTLSLDPRRRYWLQVLGGPLAVDGALLGSGDGLAIAGEGGALALAAASGAGAAVLVFDIPQ